MKQANKKLDLNKKIITVIDTEDLSAIKGGDEYPCGKTWDCPALTIYYC